MKFIIAVALLLSSPSFAQLPPVQYDRPFPGKLRTFYGAADEISRWCYGSTACAYKVGPRECHVFLKEDTPAVERYKLRHEIGHCNGWPWYHPGGRW